MQNAALLEPKATPRLIDINEVKAQVGAKSDATIYQWIKSRNFPRPVNTGKRFARWVESEVSAWILARIHERDAA